MEPLTEHRPLHGPVVYGYLYVIKAPALREAAVRDTLLDYCRRHELVLGGVFTERQRPSSSTSVAFTGLLDVLAMPETYGVLLPTAAHLGPKHIAAERRDLIAAAGARLLLIRPRAAQAGASATVRRTVSEGSPT